MKIIITIDLDDDFADPDHQMEITEEGYQLITDALGDLGSDIDVRRAP